MRGRVLLMVGALLALTPPTLGAQGQDCELLPGAREATRSLLGGQELIYVSGPARFICPGEVVLQADSAVGSRSLGEVELIGNVFYQDSVKVLTAAWARYVIPDARLIARGDVVLTDRKSESVVNGTELEYLLANEIRPESEAIIQGRPHAVFQQQRKPRPEKGDSPALPRDTITQPADSAAQPLEVDADVMRIFGESRFVALGQVELIRGETRGYAREGEFDQEGHTMVLIGAARLEGEDFTLSGDRVEATLDGDRLDLVVARQDAALQAEDLDLQAPELRVFFQEGEVQRLVAIRDIAADETSTTLAAQPVITSPDLRLVADSIDAIAPGQQIERLIAVGAAYAVRSPDSLDIGLPEAIAYDWLAGDTITGYFAAEATTAADTLAKGTEGAERLVALEMSPPLPEITTPEGDTAQDAKSKPRTVLQRLVAVGEGGGARSLYRIREKGHETEPPSVNYLVANRIVLVMSAGEVSDVEAEGPIEGMHLQPAGAPKGGERPAGNAGGTIPGGGTAGRHR